MSHDAGHLWETLLGWRGNPHLNPLHLLANLLIAGGFILLGRSWPVLYEAQQHGTIATSGPYAYVRHPQYVAFIVIMLGFLLQWPTLLTLIMFPVLAGAYVRLSRREEQEVRRIFGNDLRCRNSCVRSTYQGPRRAEGAYQILQSMISVSETVEIQAPAPAVFAYVDDIHNLGWHKTGRSSTVMMGSRLRLKILSDQTTGLGATYRYAGTIMGLPIDFSESVTTYLPPREKVRRTIGEPRLLIISSYEMRLAVEPLSPPSSRLTISIVYKLPRSGFWRMVGLLLARPYSGWCLRQMLQDTRNALEAPVR
jgi:hypothetical protein